MYKDDLMNVLRGLHLFVLDNFRRIRYIELYLKKKTVTTLVGGSCRAVARWTVYESIIQRRVGCHPAPRRPMMK